MKKLICAVVVGSMVLGSLSFAALAETGQAPAAKMQKQVPPEVRAAKDAVKAKRDTVQQARDVKRELVMELKAILEQERADAGIIPLTEAEKATFQAVKEDVMPLMEQMKVLKADLDKAKAEGDEAGAAALKTQIADLKTQIDTEMSAVADLKVKITSNREKAKATFKTEEVAAKQRERKELLEQVKVIHTDIKAIIAQIKTAKTEQDYDTIIALSNQLLEKLTQVEQNIASRTTLVQDLISILSR